MKRKPQEPPDPQVESEILYRSCTAEIVQRSAGDGTAEGQDKRGIYDLSFSSNTPVMRRFGLEILSHEPGAVDLGRAQHGLSVRDGHFGDQVGIGENVRADGGKLRAAVRFSRNDRAQEIERDVVDGIRKTVSAGYTVQERKLVEKGKNDGPDTYLATRWTPIHIAMEPDPGDYTVGVGRDIQGGLAREDESMCTKCGKSPCACTPETRQAAPDKPAGSDVSVGIVEGERLRVREISGLCDAHGIPPETRNEWIEKGTAADEARKFILNRSAPKQFRAQPASEVIDGASQKDRSGYSYRRALNILIGKEKMDGVEAEVASELAKVNPAQRGGFLLPMDLGLPKVQHRTLGTDRGGSGAELVAEQQQDMIELLRNRAILGQLGATILTGVTAPMTWPKQTAGSSGSWVGENPGSDLSDSEFATGFVSMSLKTYQATIPVPRQLLVMTGGAAESIIRGDIAATHALALDKAGIYGKGTNAQPTGIYNTPGVLTKDFASGVPDWTKLVDMTGQVAKKNALQGALAWVTTSLMAAKLMTVLRASNVAGWIWNGTVGEGELAGYRSLSSNQMSDVMATLAETGGTEHGIIFGNWAELIVGLGPALEVIEDPYAKKKQGIIEFTSFQMNDDVIRHPESFIVSTTAKTS